MLKEDLENAIIYSNICLKRWDKEGVGSGKYQRNNARRIVSHDDVTSLVRGWINKVILKNTFQVPGSLDSHWRAKRSLSRGMLKSLFFTLHEEDGNCYISSLILRDNKQILLEGISLDFQRLNEEAVKIMEGQAHIPASVNLVNFKEIEAIKFS